MWRRRSAAWRTSPILKEYADAVMEQDGIKPLGPGELRPVGYYSAGPFTWGRKPIDLEKYRERHKNDPH